MTRRLIGMTLTVLLASAPAYSETIAEAAARAAAAQAPRRPAARGDNPYDVPGWLLIAGGGTVLFYGLVVESGVECSSTLVTFNCETTRSKGAIVGGAAAAGLGAFLLMKGSRDSNRPQLVPLARGAAVRQRIRW